MKRVRLLSAGKAAALLLFITIAVALVLYLVLRSKRVQTNQARPKLQGKVVAVFSNTRYAHEVNGQVRFNITAGTDRAYEDGTHELEQVKVESYGSKGDRHDAVTADRAKVSDPSDLAKLDAEFISNVVVQTSEGLTLKTNYLHYDQTKNTVDTKEPVEFEGRNYAGQATGLIIEANDERARLLKDVDVTIKPGEANRDGKTNEVSPASRQREETAEEKAARKARKRARKEARRAAEAVAQTAAPSAQPSQAGRKQASNRVEVRKPTRIQSVSALLEKKEHRVTFEGNVIVTQDTDESRAERMVAYTDAGNHLERIEARGNAYLKQAEKAEIKSPDMDFFFGESHQIARAVATGGAYTKSLGPEPVREASAQTIEATFAAGPRGNVVDTIKAQGSAVIKMHAPPAANNKSNPAERELTAETVSLTFFSDGRNIKFAEAIGNCVMTVTPIRAEPRADKKTIRAPRMDASFYETGNRVKTFNAVDTVRVEIEAMAKGGHPLRVTTSKRARADFLEDSQDMDRVSQDGNFKYNEGERNAVAERAVYDGQKEVLNLRGKRPMVWDAKARTQADEIDYDRERDETHARGDVRTTYYSRETTNESTPFKNTKSPIFMTAERADAKTEGVAVYIGSARGWQDDNFVKADRIELYQDDKRMVAIGHVESALYQAKRETSPGKREIVPGFATAEKMTYSDIERKVHYEGEVKARQGTDRIDASVVDVYLKQETNEID
ncbi:MAG TPA: LPS export ABC transporter periplasmic protein LptC, partial [Blastocatellia bacterium]|nr:LPS export ABC transporter periplasmic protein LptC [Blastocatellia bacterium]